MLNHYLVDYPWIIILRIDVNKFDELYSMFAS